MCLTPDIPDAPKPTPPSSEPLLPLSISGRSSRTGGIDQLRVKPASAGNPSGINTGQLNARPGSSSSPGMTSVGGSSSSSSSGAVVRTTTPRRGTGMAR